MDFRTAIGIALATFTAGVLRELYKSYREWKLRRDRLPHAERNAGVLTDGRLRIFEIVAVLALASAAAFVVFSAVWMIGLMAGWWSY